MEPLYKNIEFSEKDDKKWTFLQYVYEIFCFDDFQRLAKPINVTENNGIIHNIYLNLTKDEFIRYLYFIDIKSVKIRGKNIDCILTYDIGKIELDYYDKILYNDVCEILDKINEIVIEPMPKFDTKMYFYVNKTGDEYFDFIEFLSTLPEVDIHGNGIKICDHKGEFIQYYTLRFPRENLDKFLYYDGNIFIGSHSKNKMLALFNLPKERIMEIRTFCLK